MGGIKKAYILARQDVFIPEFAQRMCCIFFLETLITDPILHSFSTISIFKAGIHRPQYWIIDAPDECINYSVSSFSWARELGICYAHFHHYSASSKRRRTVHSTGS
jgi:hypothetical protein